MKKNTLVLTKTQILTGWVKQILPYVLIPFILIGRLFFDKLTQHLLEYLQYKDFIYFRRSEYTFVAKGIQKADLTTLHKDIVKYIKRYRFNAYTTPDRPERIILTWDKLNIGSHVELTGGRISDDDIAKYGKLKGNRLYEFLEKNNIANIEEYLNNTKVIFGCVAKNYAVRNSFYWHRVNYIAYRKLKKKVNKAIKSDIHILRGRGSHYNTTVLGDIFVDKHYGLLAKLLKNDRARDYVYSTLFRYHYNNIFIENDISVTETKRRIQKVIDEFVETMPASLNHFIIQYNTIKELDD